MQNQYYVYILASKRNGTLYTGFSSNLVKRNYEHRNGIIEGFTTRYTVKMLVYYEIYFDPTEAIIREKRLKTWNRKWKLELIEKQNPDWEDLYYKIIK